MPMTAGEKLEQRIGALLRAAPPPERGDRATDDHLRAVAQVVGLCSADLTATTAGCHSGAGQEWAAIEDARGRTRGVLWGRPDGTHAADAHVFVLAARLLPGLIEEVLEAREACATAPADDVWGPGQ